MPLLKDTDLEEVREILLEMKSPVKLVHFHAEFENSLGEPEYPEGRVIEAWRFRSAWQGKIHLVRNLRRQFVEGQRGDQADDPARNLHSHRDEIGVPQRRQIGEAVKAPAQARQAPRIAHRVERFGVDAEAERIFGSEHTSVLPEDAPGAGGTVSNWSS